MKYVFALGLILGLSACYTPRDVRPAAVAEAKAAVVKDLPVVAGKLTQEQPNRAAMIAIFEKYLASHPGVYGMAFAPGPVSGGATPKPALYVYRHGGGFKTTELALPDYNYPRMEWYWKPVQQMEACWCAPYFDVDGGNVWMQTYSIPLISGSGGVYGVLTNDVPVYRPNAN